jgi:DNA-binding transcriptional MerR regulator
MVYDAIMPYTIKQLAKLAGISVRTLHHYDEVGLLKPARAEKNGYRQYDDNDLMRLQQILFFRELEFPLEEVGRIMASPDFDMRAALREHRKLIEMKKKRLTGLITTIDKTIKRLDNEITMKDEELYCTFTKDEMEKYAEEARQRWGHTEAFRQSQERTKKFTKEDWKRFKEGAEIFGKKLASMMGRDPKGPEFQELVDQHYNALRTFYEPNLELYRGLADLYVNDPRFTAYYEKFAPGLAAFLREGMIAYCEKNRNK